MSAYPSYSLLEVIQAQALPLVLFHWFIRVLLTPAIVGNLISFMNVPPGPTNVASAPQIILFDPLTPAIS